MGGHRQQLPQTIRSPELALLQWQEQMSLCPALGPKQAPGPSPARASQALSLRGWAEEERWHGEGPPPAGHGICSPQHTSDGGNRWVWGQGTKEPMWVTRERSPPPSSPPQLLTAWEWSSTP